MINLTKDVRNTVIFTLTENEDIYSGYYYLNLTNSQSYKETSDIYIVDVSPNTARFNQFYIQPATIFEDYTFTEDFYTDGVVFLKGTITLPAGITFEVGSGGAVVSYTGTTADIQGTAIINGQQINADFGDIQWYSEELLTNYKYTTFIFDNLLGFYDYEVYSAETGSDTLLEFGKAYVIGPAASVVTATHSEEKIIAKRRN